MNRVLILFLLLHSTVFAQRKLKYDIIKDTGDTMFYTSEQRLYVSAGNSSGSGRNRTSTVADNLKSTVYKYPNGFALAFYIQTGRTNNFWIYAGHTAKLIMSDESVITLTSRGDHSSKKSSMGYGCWLYAFYRMSASDLEKLKTGTITHIRIETSMGSFDYPLKEKAGSVIAEQVSKF